MPLIGSVLPGSRWRVPQFKRAYSSPPVPDRGTTTSADFSPPCGDEICLLPGLFHLAGYVRCAPIPQVIARCSTALPPHLPPRAYQFAFGVLCHLDAPCRPSMRFLSIGSRFSPSLPSPSRSPFPSWLQMVVSSFSCSGISTGDLNPVYNVPMLGTHKASIRTPDPLRVGIVLATFGAGSTIRTRAPWSR